MASGFWQIPLDTETKHKTAFTTPYGNYNFTRLPFGMRNAPASFQSIMNSVLHGLTFQMALVYVDDVIIFSDNLDSHMKHLECIFQRLRAANLTLQPSKCNFAATKVLYLGHVISKEGVRVDPKKTEAVESFPRPRNPKELRQFLGLANFYRRFVLGYAKIATPLNVLLKKDAPFQWSENCEAAFQNLKDRLVSAPILAYPDMTQPFRLTTDASATAIGYILSQMKNGQEHPIAYGGRATRQAEKNYCITDLECLAVLEGVNAYRPYLAHREFDVFTDHSALTSLMKMKDLKGRSARWSLTLQGYTFKIHHRPGVKNKNADALSRRPYPEPLDPETNEDDAIPGIFAIDPTVFSQAADTDNSPSPNMSLTKDVAQTEELTELHLQYDSDPVAQKVVYTISPADSRDLKELQSECSVFSPMVEYMLSGKLPDDKSKAKHILAEASQYVLCDQGILYHLYEPRTRGTQRLHTVIRQLAVPESLREEVMEQHHDELLGGGHQGFDRTYHLVRQRYYWPRMYSDLQQYVKSCDSCQKAKTPQHAHPPPLTPLPIVPKFHRWHMDILELSVTSDGYRYVLLMVDSLTRWMEAIPLKTQEANEVAQVIYRELISRYGAPRVLVSDRGRNFLSKVVKALSSLFEIKRHHTTAYHPQTNSCCERVNRTLGQALRAYCQKQEQWIDALPGIMMALRRTPCDRSTKYSPFLLTFGQEMQAPIDVSLHQPTNVGQTVETYVEKLKTQLIEAEKIATENCELSQQQYKSDHDVRAKLPTYKLGDKVLLFSPKVPVGKSRKLHRKWTGPYFITELGPNHTYKLCNCVDNKELLCLVNARRLQAYDDPMDRPKPTPDPQSQTPVTADQPNSAQGDSMPGPQDTTDPSQTWYRVKKICTKRKRNGKMFYKIKWEGYTEPTWEPEINLSPALLQEYKLSLAQRRSNRRKKSKQ